MGKMYSSIILNISAIPHCLLQRAIEGPPPATLIMHCAFLHPIPCTDDKLDGEEVNMEDDEAQKEAIA